MLLTPADKPCKPGASEVKEATKTSATLAFQTMDDGGSEVINYLVI